MKVLRFINRLSKTQKLIFLFLITSFALIISVLIPTLASFKNSDGTIITDIWDGTIASSYASGEGTIENPYVISNGAELAYLSAELQNTDYLNNYFIINKNIVLNKGILNYSSENGIEYILDGNTYYVKEFTNDYYETADKNGDAIGQINLFPSLQNFKGDIDAGLYSIYGLYITDEETEELGLFTNLNGKVSNLFIRNSLINGGITTGGIASSTNNATLNNIIFDGNVINNKNDKLKSATGNVTVNPIDIYSYQTTKYLDLSNYIYLNSDIQTIKVTGNYTLSGVAENTTIKINNQEINGGTFSIDINPSDINNISITTSTNSLENPILTFNNFSYQITYNYQIAGGIIANAGNTIITNTINKANIYANHVGGGIVGVATQKLDIISSYSTGNITSNVVTGGLVGAIESATEEFNIGASYSTSSLTSLVMGGITGTINNSLETVNYNGIVDVTNSNNPFGIIKSDKVDVTNSYYITFGNAASNGNINGSFIRTTIENLKNENYLMTNLALGKYLDEEDLSVNPNNIWIFEPEEFPKLYLDIQYSKIGNINVANYTFNKYNLDLEINKLTTNITFNIEYLTDLNPVKEIKYYLNLSETPLTKSELNLIETWEEYDGIKIIYAKFINYKDEITYLNTNILMLDSTKPNIIINNGNYTWTDLKEDRELLNVNKPQSITLETNDELSGIASIKYYVSSSVLSKESLENLDDNLWQEYDSEINITEIGKTVVNIQVIDNFGNTTYANTDIIDYEGYTINYLKLGLNNNYENLLANITSKSALKLNASFTSSDDYGENITHYLKTNILLPKGTQITLIDNINNKKYSYQIKTSADNYNFESSCEGKENCSKTASYTFTLFKEVSVATNKLFKEESYYKDNKITENFTVIIDFAKTNISVNYNEVKIYLEIQDESGKVIKSTLEETMQSFNIYSKVNNELASGTLSLQTNYSGNEILYNTSSSTDINLTNLLNYKNLGELQILDTTFENKKTGLEIKLFDANGVVVNKKYLKNMIFKVGNKEYYPDNYNNIKIPLNNILLNNNVTLTILTTEENTGLTEGNYYFKVSSYASLDGYNNGIYSTNEITIPVKVANNNYNSNYGYSVNINPDNQIINKTSEHEEATFNIYYSGYILNPNIRVSLYEKKENGAITQEYIQKDLQQYVTNSLILKETDIYQFVINNYQNNEIKLKFQTNKLKNTSYKLIFELYNGDKRIDTIKKYFIAK